MFIFWRLWYNKIIIVVYIPVKSYLYNMELVKIYILICPLDIKVRYIGRTKISLNSRLSQHIHEALHKRVTTHKSRWIQKLHRLNCKPVIRLLCTVEGWAKSYVLEQSLIEKYSERLLNHRDRGMGNNYPKSETHKKNISLSMSQGYHTGSIKHPREKTVFCYDMKGTFLFEFSSLKEASEKLSIHRSGIEKILAGTQTQVKGYRFSYFKKDFSDLSLFKKGNTTKITVNKENKEYFFNSVKECRNYFSLKGFGNYLRTKKSLEKLGYNVNA